MNDNRAEEKLEDIKYRLKSIKCDITCGIPKIENSYTVKTVVEDLLKIIEE